MGKENRRRNDEFLDRSFLAIEKIVVGLGYECVNVALVTEEGRPVLRVMVDSIGGINVRDCETVSKAINHHLDAPDLVETAYLGDKYYLEVSSPGLERPLFTSADYERFRGKEARVRTGEPVDGRKTHVGFIAASDDESVTLDTEQGARNLRFADITRASLVFRGLEPQPPPKAKKRNKENEKPDRVEKKSSKTVIETVIEEEQECS